MKTTDTQWLDALAQNGFTILPAVFAAAQVEACLDALQQAFAQHPEAVAARSDNGSVYAARNVLDLWPGAATFWRQPPLPDVLCSVLGPGFGLVRTLFFDKPPESSWALPWHKDLTIAVRDNRLASEHFSHPTRKSGVPHVEAPVEVLERMVTARIHLDDVTEENGPLNVLPGSHQSGKQLVLGETSPRSVLVRRGDVLLMRPLLAHNSGRSRTDTRRHRRILHFEFAAAIELPDGYAWHAFHSTE
jgi:hypothetical protein